MAFVPAEELSLTGRVLGVSIYVRLLGRLRTGTDDASSITFQKKFHRTLALAQLMRDVCLFPRELRLET